MHKGELTRTSILERAVSMASVVGFEGISIGRLATEAGMSKSGLFGHFGSKEALQHAILEFVIEDFRINVIGPALRESTGEAKLRSLFSRWLEWTGQERLTGGCPLVTASVELDDQPGPLRDFLVEQQEAWLDCIRRMAQKSVAEGRFRDGLDTRQFAFEFHGIGLAFNFARRLLKDPNAPQRAKNAFDRLIESART
jgi:AcrR family transcriptional regulator